MKKQNKTQTVIADVHDKIAWGVYKLGGAIPSVRHMAKQAGVSAYTVTQAYGHLVATGDIESKKGVGYFVASTTQAVFNASPKPTPKPLNNNTVNSNSGDGLHGLSLPDVHKANNVYTSSMLQSNQTTVSKLVNKHVLDTSWMMGHAFHDLPELRGSGNGLLKDSWMLDPTVVGRCSRQVIRQIGQFINSYGHLQGYLGLRQQFANQLKADNINADPNQMITTAGVSHAMELLLRTLCVAGDNILVDDPCWYWIIGCAQQMGVNVIGVPRCEEGVDLKYFEHCLKRYQPKLYMTNSRLHNPTGNSFLTNQLYQVLSLLKQHNSNINESFTENLTEKLEVSPANLKTCYLVEDDVFGHLCNDNQTLRFASLDGFETVIYVSGVAKSLGGNWRVGVMVSPEALLQPLLRHKLLSQVACSELNERIIEQLWQDSSYPRHICKMRQSVRQCYFKVVAWLMDLTFIVDESKYNLPNLFIWLDIGVDSAQLALDAHKAQWHIAPGHLFSANGNFNTYIRLNVGTVSYEFLQWLRLYVDTVLTTSKQVL